MNDVVREVGGTLGVAVLGSVLTTSYGSGMDDAPPALPHAAAEAASDSVGAAHEVGAQLGGGAGATLIDTANSAFVDAMATTATLAAAAAVIGALIALAFLPSRDRAERPAPLGADAARAGPGLIPPRSPTTSAGLTSAGQPTQGDTRMYNLLWAPLAVTAPAANSPCPPCPDARVVADKRRRASRPVHSGE